MADQAKSCPKCGSPMTLHKRPRPQGSSSMFMGEDHWLCTNPTCKNILIEPEK